MGDNTGLPCLPTPARPCLAACLSADRAGGQVPPYKTTVNVIQGGMYPVPRERATTGSCPYILRLLTKKGEHIGSPPLTIPPIFQPFGILIREDPW